MKLRGIPLGKAALLCLLFMFALPALAQVPLQPHERQWIESHRVIRYTIFPGLHPMEDLEDGRPTGIVPAYLEMIGRDAGLQFVYVPTHSWNEAVDRFLRGEIDVLPNVTPTLAGSVRPDQTVQTVPYFSSPLVAIGRAHGPIVTTLDDMQGKTIALRARDGVRTIEVPGVRVIHYADTASMLNAVSSGVVDYAVGSEAVYPPVVRSQHVGRLGIAGYLDLVPLESRMLVLKKNTALLGILNSTITHLTAEETDLLYLNSLERVEYGAPNARAIWRYLGVEVALLAGMLVALAIALAWAFRARTAARRNELAKARFLAMMSHEVRTPVNIMVGSIEAIEQTGLSRRQQEIMRIVSASADHLVDLLNNVLDLSKLEEDQLVLSPISVAPERLLSEIVSLAKVQADVKGLTLRLHTQGLEGVLLMLDATRLRQVMNNLLSNALKFTERGQIDVNASLVQEQGQRHLVLSVADTGIGIAADKQAGLFEPYVQADGSITRRYGGTGLGLSLCKRLVELMGGRVELESRLGHGTTLRFRIPVQLAPGERTSLPILAGGAPETTQLARVMIVDDVFLNASVLKDQLAGISVSASIFVDAESALADLDQQEYDLVLLDCHMPGMDGYEAVRTIKALRKTTAPVIAISASTGTEHQVRCTSAGFDGTLSKPLRTKDIIGLLDLWGIRHGGVSEPDPEAAGHMTDFLEQLASDWVALHDSCRKQDHEESAHHAHRIKGVALVFGNEALAGLVSQAEVLASDGADVPADLLEEIEACLRQSYPAIDLRHGEAP